MTGLLIKDLLVFRRLCKPVYCLLGVLLLLGITLLFPQAALPYIALLLPLAGVAFLAELARAEEKSDWQSYLPVLPITDKEIVAERYLFSGVLFAAFSVLAAALCLTGAAAGHLPLTDAFPNLALGMCCTVLMVCLGVPAGFFFKQTSCTGAMIAAILLCSLFRSAGWEAAFFAAPPFPAYTLLAVALSLLLLLSYLVSLSIFRKKRQR